MGQTAVRRTQATWPHKVAYTILLFAVSGWILAVFVTPEPASVGINQYHRSKFLDMVEGTAYRPFVYRTLLPTTTRLISDLTPDQVTAALSDGIEGNYLFRKAFSYFGWETATAYQYAVACLLMLLSFMGFAHSASRLAIQQCGIADTIRMRSLLAVAALLGLPPFFSYTAYVYDPPQLFLFTLALYCLANRRIVAFALAFALCCVNKETAVLLILVFAFTSFRQMPRRQYVAMLLGLASWYALTRLVITFIFRNNPGSFAEFHLFDHNLRLFMMDWSFTDLVTWLVLAVLVLFGWKEKPQFLKVSFVVVLVPLVLLGLLLGYVDEWRGYYEAYPLAFGLAVDTVSRLNTALGGVGGVHAS